MSASHEIEHPTPRSAYLAGHGSWLLLALTALTAIAIARQLHPDARGFGTHTQLGIPACGFLALTGFPCPACGLTTCFAHMSRGQFTQALAANAIGVVMFGAVLVTPVFAVWAIARKRAFFETCARMRIDRVCIAFACALLLQWVVRVACLLLG